LGFVVTVLEAMGKRRDAQEERQETPMERVRRQECEEKQGERNKRLEQKQREDAEKERAKKRRLELHAKEAARPKRSGKVNYEHAGGPVVASGAVATSLDELKLSESFDATQLETALLQDDVKLVHQWKHDLADDDPRFVGLRFTNSYQQPGW